MVQLFSVVAMFIMFRETLEACVVVAIMLNLCNRLNMAHLKKQVWWGVATGALISLAIGIAFIVAFYVAKNSLFSGKGQAIFKGYIDMVATYLISLLGFAMLRFMNYEKKWARKLKDAHEESERRQKKSGKRTQWGIFLLCFSAVFREGIEAVIFLAGVSTTESITAIPIAGIVGILCGLVCGFLLFFTGRKIKDLWWFFVLSFILLFMIAAGLISTGITAWQSIGWFGTYWPASMRPWWNQPVWDTCGCCSDNIAQNKFFGLISALFGYQCQPTFISIFTYFMFWAIVLFCLFVKWRRGGLTDAMYKRKRKEDKRRKKLGLPPKNWDEEDEEEESNDPDTVMDPKESPRASSSSNPTDSDDTDKAKLAAIAQPTSEDPFFVTPSQMSKETELTPGRLHQQ